MRIVAHGASFAQGLVLEDKRLGLLAMTLGAGFIAPGHGQAAGWLHDVRPVRVVALDAVHTAFHDGMVLGQLEFRVNVQMTIKASRGIFAGVDDEPAATSGLDMVTAWAVAGLAAALAGHGRSFDMDSRVRAGGKIPDIGGMAIQAGLVADKMRAGNFGWVGNHVGRSGAGIQQARYTAPNPTSKYRDQARNFHRLLTVAPGRDSAPDGPDTGMAFLSAEDPGTTAAAFNISFAIESDRFPPTGIVV